jgi:hypothetical protein
MTTTEPAPPSRAELDAALLLLDRMGIAPAHLITTAANRPPAPTFAEYVPVVAAMMPVRYDSFDAAKAMAVPTWAASRPNANLDAHGDRG